jgi:hypothetical protein
MREMPRLGRGRAGEIERADGLERPREDRRAGGPRRPREEGPVRARGLERRRAGRATAAARGGPATLAALALLVLGHAPASVARAERIAVLPVHGSQEAPARLRAQVRDAVVAALAAVGDSPVAGPDLERALARARVPACASLDCAAAVRQAASAATVIEVTLWTSERGEARELVITRQDARGQEGSGTLPLPPHPTPDELRAAVREALARSLDTLTPEGGVEVSIRSRPVEAALSLDGRPLGRTPWRGLLPPGRHVVVAGAAGRRSVRRELDVPPRAQAPTEVVIDLEADPEATAAEAAAVVAAPTNGGAGDATGPAAGRETGGRETGDSGARAGGDASASSGGGALRVLAPLGVAALGVALLAVDVAALLSTGCRVTEAGGACAEERTLDPVPFAIYGTLGVAALAGGIIWLALAIAAGGGGDDTAGAPPRRATARRLLPRVALGGDVSLDLAPGALRLVF